MENTNVSVDSSDEINLPHHRDEPTKNTCSTGQTVEKVVAVEKDVEDINNINDWEEKDVFLRSWISGTLTEESMYLIVGCSTAKEMWLGTKKIDEYIKEFKGIYDGLAPIHKPVDEDSKVISFARGLGLKYKTFRTVMLATGEEETTLKEKETITSIPEEEASSLLDKEHVRIIANIDQVLRIVLKWKSVEEQNNYTALKCFYKWDYSYQAGDKLPQALASTNLQNTTNGTLYVDSGASSHMTHNLGILTDLRHYNGPDKILIGNGSKLDITHVANISGSCLKLREELVVPKINKNLLLVSKFVKDNCCTLEFAETNFVVKDKKTRTLLAKGYKRNGLYALEYNNLYALTVAHGWNISDNMWHTRLRHRSLKSLKVLNSNKCINVSS
ncbi:hypothetical protein KY285_012952 [Solanum tuberosum]|nr:hypothetical protein KY285_012952 [Solanum tuberosum]